MAMDVRTIISHEDRINIRYEKLLAEYLKIDLISTFQNEKNETRLKHDVLEQQQNDEKVIELFLETECACGDSCNKKFTKKELLSSRAQFSTLSLSEKNCYILAQLRIMSKHTELATSSRTKTTRVRQRFDYRINADRSVCRDAFLFYHGETIKRLQRLQECLVDTPLQPPMHGNTGRCPQNTYSSLDKELAKSFIISFAEIHGLPDPGRDVRKGRGRLRILLPSVMNYTSIHRLYVSSIGDLGRIIPYRTFIELWHEELPQIEFNNPRTDFCMTCESFKKEINQAVANSDEEKEKIEAELYQKALDHLNHVKKERLYYKAHSKESLVDYSKLQSTNITTAIVEANSRDIVMSYSWDFAQQFQYPFEDQQVGPIYFKTPRRAQLFGVCCEGSARQINYLIDEADFLEKNANTVISLLDHFFSYHSMGEMTAYLTADNCVGQNKNNALIQYLMYRVCSGLHSKIEMSFLVVGHTKFSPDSHFGLIRQRYRKSAIYTYDQLIKVIEESIKDGCNACQRYSSDASTGIIYRDWTSWLARYFKLIPNITSYQHFIMNSKEKGVITVKKAVDSSEHKITILNDKRTIGDTSNNDKPERLFPKELAIERQWYLYEHIREHIPSLDDQDITCPKPTQQKPKTNKHKVDNYQ